ncbi:hypothetical protein V1J52_13320 [Streptomyces sp. TRM 70351]|uniref:hypothetical protein n=1 Tax=Streptomyces sp. TRM 70351 TaxID=3116552 RepID=UPI002E7C458A|nr:hypothetical protein [Streptomyces sp. TRM 70351]MEE1929144.1 hypothetical protein [Streptomyces sp. TRM 70351]
MSTEADPATWPQPLPRSPHGPERPARPAHPAGPVRPPVPPQGAAPSLPPRPPAGAPPRPPAPPRTAAPSEGPAPHVPCPAPPAGWPADGTGAPPQPPGGPPAAPRPRRNRPRTAAAALCLVLGVGLVGGAATGSWLGDPSSGGPTAAETYGVARDLWRELPVDTLFPRILDGEGAGPGGADRRWIRAAVAPAGTCAQALDELLVQVLAPVGCHRLVRATYIDETSSSLTTVGLVFTEADPAGMRELHRRFAAEELAARPDLMPRPYAPRGTDAAGFGDDQRATWTVRVATDVPVITYAVTGFADGRAVSDPQPADEATADGQTTAPAQAGLGHTARAVAERVERGVREAAAHGARERR